MHLRYHRYMENDDNDVAGGRKPLRELMLSLINFTDSACCLCLLSTPGILNCKFLNWDSSCANAFQHSARSLSKWSPLSRRMRPMVRCVPADFRLDSALRHSIVASSKFPFAWSVAPMGMWRSDAAVLFLRITDYGMGHAPSQSAFPWIKSSSMAWFAFAASGFSFPEQMPCEQLGFSRHWSDLLKCRCLSPPVFWVWFWLVKRLRMARRTCFFPATFRLLSAVPELHHQCSYSVDSVFRSR